MVFPAVIVNELTSATCVLPGDVVPTTVTGSAKFPPVGAAAPLLPLSVLPPKRLPRVPGSMADCRLVVPVAIGCPSGRVGRRCPR